MRWCSRNCSTGAVNGVSGMIQVTKSMRSAVFGIDCLLSEADAKTLLQNAHEGFGK